MAGIGFTGAHGDAPELLEFGEKTLDQLALFVDIEGSLSSRVLRDDDLCAALVVHLHEPPIVDTGTTQVTRFSKAARGIFGQCSSVGQIRINDKLPQKEV